MKALIEFLARTLVQHPDSVEVAEPEPGRLELRTHPDDVGAVIGRRGRTAQAMRAILEAMASAEGGGLDPELEIGARTESGAE